MYQAGYSASHPMPHSAAQSARHVRDYEQKYLTEAQRIPAYYDRDANPCAMSYLYPAPQPPMRTKSIDMRQNELGVGARSAIGVAALGRPAARTMEILPVIGGELIILFMFMVLVFLCVLGAKAVAKILGGLKKLRKSAKK
jgi:hypothetical protein